MLHMKSIENLTRSEALGNLGGNMVVKGGHVPLPVPLDLRLVQLDEAH